MAVQDVPFSGILWFLTRSTSNKIREIEQDSRITLSFAEPKDSKYLALKGHATVTQDRSKIKELWNPLYKAWFSGGADDPEIRVLRIEVTEADFWEASSNRFVMGMKYVVAAMTGGTLPLGDAGHINV